MRIWCPFDTEDSLFVKLFRQAGYQVIATHIANGQDFFTIDPPKCDYIISNPPYSVKGEVLQRLFDLGIPFAKMDVQGISAIIDLAHRIISLYRVQEKDKQGEPKLNGNGWRVKPIKADVIMDILKDRLTGYESRSIEVYYDYPSKRFFTSEAELDYQYKWDKTQYKTPLPFPPQQLIEEDNEDEVFGKVDEQ